ncbi:MAG: penicillin-binding protein 1A [Alphaproteobacteria bacterium]|nr:penicillin-binding protein 1A [Alphaproteobacteria bacterium]
MRFIISLFSFGLLLAGLAAVAVVGLFDHYGRDLPDYTYLKDYQPPTLTRIYADDGRMMATIAEEQRIFVPIKAIPSRVKAAFLSAEDEDFYNHNGVDYFGITRAVLINLRNLGHERHPMGASTITQQVAKNMLLTNEVSIERKVKEAILATRLEKVLSKDRILEIYLNEIFLGNHSYGVAAAALNYFNKSLDELSYAEAAYLAALPKAPNSYNPVRDHDAAVARRNWVLERMQLNGYINDDQRIASQAEPLEMHKRGEAETVSADYFSEEVRRQLVAQFGEDDVLEGGLAVKTSLDSRLQGIAEKALRDGLVSFDRRERGWRGPVARLTGFSDWQRQMKKIAVPPGGEEWMMAVVMAIKDSEAQIAFADNQRGVIPWNELKWARREMPNDEFGPAIHRPADVLNVGDIILVEPVKAGEDGKPYPEHTYTLRQVPVIQGAIVALDPNTGRVFAMNGGFSAKISQFNRVTQAARQPGSSFKPFVYMAALDKGFTPSSLILDAPFEYFQGPGLPLWHPENYSQEFYGPTPLRVGIEKSRNVMTVRLANAIGMPTVVEYAKKFGIADEMPELLSFALGAKEATPLRMATAYGMIVNGGRKITPSLIDRVQDRDGKTIWRADHRDCNDCQVLAWSPEMTPPDVPDTREQVEDPRTAYQMVSIMQGVVQRGTAAKLRDTGIPLAGKTGTTNESKDAWFIGFTPDLVCAVYVGFDDPKPLGSHETGASVAVPIFKQFITETMKGKPLTPFRVPPGLRMVRINPETGALASMGDKESIWEAYIPGTEPQEGQQRPILDGSVTGAASEGAAAAMTKPATISATPAQSTTAPAPAVPSQAGIPAQAVAPSPAPAAVVPPPIVNKQAAPAANSTVGTGGLY